MGHCRMEPVAGRAWLVPRAQVGLLVAGSLHRRPRSDLQCSGPLSKDGSHATRVARDFREIPAKLLRLIPAKMIWLQSSSNPNATATCVLAVINKHKFLRTRWRNRSNFNQAANGY